MAAAGTIEARGIDLRGYLGLSRRVSLSLVYVAPLFLGYELAIRVAGSDVRNAAENTFKSLFWYLGPGAGLLQAFFALVVVVAAIRVFQERLPVLRILVPFLTEALLLALVLGPLVAFLTGAFPLDASIRPRGDDLLVSVLSSVGAGLYEEILFRLVLLGGLYVVLLRFFGLGKGAALAIAIGLSAILFAAYHHVGPYGEPLVARAFAFRGFAGILLGLIFAARGLGVVVYLHAFYDVLYDLRVAAWL